MVARHGKVNINKGFFLRNSDNLSALICCCFIFIAACVCTGAAKDAFIHINKKGQLFNDTSPLNKIYHYTNSKSS